jgi:deoxycytidylate deaminase
VTDAEILRAACEIARSDSHDPRTKNAAVLVRRTASGGIDGFVSSANRFPRGVGRVLQPPGKYERIEHAERGAIYAASRAGWRTLGATMYVPWFACPDCARAIVCAGIIEVVGVAKLCHATPARWRQAVLSGETILREAGVSMRWITEGIGTWVIFDGQEVEL